MDNQSTQNSQTQKNSGKNKGMEIVAYIVFFVPFFTDAKDDPFVKYHIKQGLVLFICSIVVWLVVNVIPVVGMLLLAPVLDIAILILMIIGIINASNGVEKPLPLIGHFAENFKF
jgi:uncharacterized membrane protein